LPKSDAISLSLSLSGNFGLSPKFPISKVREHGDDLQYVPIPIV